MVHFKVDNVLVLGDGPVWPIRAVSYVVNWIVAPEPFEIGLPNIVKIQLRITDIDLIERHGRRLGTMIEANWSIHWFFSLR